MKINLKKLINIAIYFSIALVITIIFCCVTTAIISNAVGNKTITNSQGLFLGSWWIVNINVVINEGVAFSIFDDNFVISCIVQLLSTLAVVSILFFLKNKWQIFTLSFAACGGFYNFFDKIIPKYIGKNYIKTGVLDYFQFTFWSPIFNMPDTLIFCGLVSFAIICIVALLKKENKDFTKFNLFIDGTQNKLNLAIFYDKQIIDKISIHTNNNLTDLIVEEIKKLFKKNGIKDFKNLESIYLVNGPGSFTGTRITTLIAKTFNNINKDIKYFYISSNELQSKKNSISIIDSKGNKFYTLINKNNTESKIEIKDWRYIEQFSKENKLPIIKDYENVNVFEMLLNNLDKFKTIDVSKLKPNYIKEPL